ncbi:hypothetical protein [Natronomonas amylolytica]|uniref:hypothetical protein n=1 Tax=Natronomonas amylolytica TaxID=3108498 RepID=UPI003008653C
MRTDAVAAGLLVALAVLAVATMGGAVADTQDNGTEANAAGANVSVGAEVSSFMQASTAEAEGEVDDGMFEASLRRTEDPEERRRLVENRTRRLEERQQRLENRRANIEGSGTVRDRALAVGVAVGANQLEESVNETEPVAERVGVDTGRLHELRTNARNLSGGDVADLARGIAGPPVDRPDVIGPPNESPDVNVSGDRGGGMGNAPEVGPGNRTAGEANGPGGQAAAPEDASNRSGNASVEDGNPQNSDDAERPNDGGSDADADADNAE